MNIYELNKYNAKYKKYYKIRNDCPTQSNG